MRLNAASFLNEKRDHPKMIPRGGRDRGMRRGDAATIDIIHQDYGKNEWNLCLFNKIRKKVQK